ncbi:EAL domain-containing protein [Rhodanobacter sp. A1T4]|uniref:EAL domain-containing protein n=1 Tax=Rhodanobacter sp. A1T4 TaxID=2723087 RepID=UPI00161E7A98|nr:EAL domain-containing protein [Rhodanobacter sp. A1T4]MBB6248415.1 EAL domain-containing protein (putative c-di-GMP-specific phosphodiesterase class I) [Rhodanobacter sp. A1T4]
MANTHAHTVPSAGPGGASAPQSAPHHLPVEQVDARGALARGEIELWFQPEFRLADGKVVAVEALARWRHPTRGILRPDAFLTQIVDEGLGVALTRQVMSACLACLTTLDRAGHSDVAVAMNVPWDWIVDRKNVDELIRLTEQAGHHPSRMIVEIVESAPLVRNAHALRNLNVLRAHGFVLALDDFGTGYNALEHLRYMPLNYIKIDRSLVEKCSDDVRGARLLQGIVAMVHGIGAAVTVEGVSREDDLNFVLALNADLAQGNLLGEAMPIGALIPWLSGLCSDQRRGGRRMRDESFSAMTRDRPLPSRQRGRPTFFGAHV